MTFAAYLGLAGAWIAAITSPGPDTVQLIRLGSRSRRNAILAALGICFGNVLWPVVTMVGLAALIATFPWILALLYLGGGLFLLRMGIGSFRGGYADYRNNSRLPVAVEGSAGVGRKGGDEGGGREGDREAAGKAGGGAGVADVQGRGVDREGTSDAEHDRQHHGNDLTDFQAWKLGLATNLSNPKALLFFGAVFAQFLPVDISLIDRVLVIAMMTVIGLIWFGGFSWAVSLPLWARKLQRANPIIEMVAGVIFAVLALFLLYEGVLTMLEYLN